ncbi:uncharacterized protein MELLADRAFT_59064 [Melampsora larici-populina 98AG31]|uniref:Uncharacterized protein n=1 Tax=Melampsora larici-populina (strain 98AG31 / pathotype 3-4-7) TaxID=747676 RepID=F4R6Y1_MELLP|nr:uncharacterized protein MELLADRAFT_59064 [Melampsora larici-populina 98AG31]EGG12376.1 hypothetical protein MELLADRAFT_59064 [Melampsora larici-populina 98AG31]
MTTYYQPSSNFCINSEDGESITYEERFLVDPSESSDHSSSSFDSSTTKSPIASPINFNVPRTRATSDALEKIMARQTQQLSAVCEEWRLKFSSSPLIPMAPKPRTRATSDALERLLARQSLQMAALGESWRAKFSSSPSKSSEDRFVDVSEDGDDERDHESEMRVSEWLDHLPDSFDEMWLAEEGSEEMSEDEDGFEDGYLETYHELEMRVFKWLENFPDSFDEMSEVI